MYRMKNRKAKNPTTIVHTPIINIDSIMITNTGFFNGREHFPRYDEIYRIFNIEDFPSNDK
jgi:hypothetical protein